MIEIIAVAFCCAILFLNRYVYFENMMLRAQLGVYRRRFRHRRLRFSESFRRFFVWMKRFWPDWRSAIIALSPRSILDWDRSRYRDFWTILVNRRRRPGRPPITAEVQKLIAKLARENITWLAGRIKGEIHKLTGLFYHLDTIRKYMPEKPRDPRNILRWKQFLKLNLPSIAAMDFFVIPRAGMSPLYGFFVIAHNIRVLLHINVTATPTADWLREQLLLAFPPESQHRFLISDNDVLFSHARDFMESVIDIRNVRTQIASPWQNGIAERFIRTLREELLDFIIPWNETMVRQRLLEYREYYNRLRTHSSIHCDSPWGRAASPKPARSRLKSRPLMGGLHHEYFWEEAA